jgi:cytochrome b subunit of formate dehydrogenase
MPRIRRTPGGELEVERFSPFRRVEHTFAIVIFATLVLTGFPQKFDQSGFGRWVLGLFGGLDSARLVHRIAGIAFAVHAALHLFAITIGLVTRRVRLTLMPLPQDLRDAWENLRFYFGHRDRPPELPKYDYRQKFEYVGLILGGMVMISSGAILMMPVLVARWLPGELIPASQVAHSNEAMLAFLVLIIWHIYATVLSPDVFPLDRSMFTGYMSAHELKEHHALEYKRVFPDGEPALLPGETADPASETAKEPEREP